MNTIRVGLECAGIAAIIWAALFVVGWPVWTLLAGRVPRLSVTTGAPLTGLAITQVVGWYWLHEWSLDPLSYALVAAGGAASLVLAIRRRVWRRLDRETMLRLGAPFIGLAGALAALFAANHSKVFRSGRLTTGALGITADLPQYVLWSDHLRHATLDEPARNIGLPLGALVADTTSGTFITLAAGAAWSGDAMWRMTLPLALAMTFITACAARDLALVAIPDRRVPATLLGLAAVAGSLFVYSASSYPLSQLVALPGMVGATAVLAHVARRGNGERWWRGTLEAAPAVAVVMLSYPHMMLLAAPVMGGVAAAAAWGPFWRRALVRTALAGAGALLLCSVVLPERLAHAVEYARYLSKAPGAGYPLPLLAPSGLLGIQGEFGVASEPSTIAVMFELVVIGALLVAAMRWAGRAGRKRAALAVGAVTIVLGSYAFIYVVRGVSYTAWKWAAFFSPLFVVGILAAVWLLATRLGARRGAAWLGTALLVGVVALQGLQAYRATDELDPYTELAAPREWTTVSEPLSTIGDGPAWRGVRKVNVELTSGWESFWSRHFVRADDIDMDGVLARGSSPRPGEWLLEDRRALPPHPPGTVLRDINDDYVLVREANRGVEPGDLWVVGNCAGLYRFDGRRWEAVERTRFTGAVDLDVKLEARPNGTVVPVVVRHTATLGHKTDVLALEYLGHDRARFVVQTAVAQRGEKRGEPFPVRTRDEQRFQLVFDALNGDVQARVDGRDVLDTRIRFLRPHYGQRPGDGITVAVSVNTFPGTVGTRPSPPPVQCTEAHAADRVQ